MSKKDDPISTDTFFGTENSSDLSDDDAFEELFSRFSDFKVTASELSRDQRLDYAEEVATAFLNALGDVDDFAPSKQSHKKSTCSKLPRKLPIDKKQAESSITTDGGDVGSKICSVKVENSNLENLFSSISLNDDNENYHIEVRNDESLNELGFPDLSRCEKIEEQVSIDPPHVLASLDLPCPIIDETIFVGRTYEDIEKEMQNEELIILAKRIKDRDEVLREIGDVDVSIKYPKNENCTLP